ncbi:MAG: hypothetical protein J7M19_05830 [Planctomycetes bacterium]|nr:hypothetical protein [Planctomycetota bacterium]
MSIIGHAIQANIANVHVALKQQQAAEVAQSQRQARRHRRILKAEEEAREAVRRAQEAREDRTEDVVQDDQKPGRRKPTGHPRDDESRDSAPDRPTDHLDLFA